MPYLGCHLSKLFLFNDGVRNRDQDPIIDYENFNMMYKATTAATMRITNQSLLIVSTISFMIDMLCAQAYYCLSRIWRTGN